LKSAVATAKESDLEPNKLYIKEVCCNEGPRLKRRRFESKGVSRQITKRMSHLVLTISDVAEEKIKKEHNGTKS
jgi:ribosomal protein L22